jgi:hypothetical protein
MSLDPPDVNRGGSYVEPPNREVYREESLFYFWGRRAGPQLQRGAFFSNAIAGEPDMGDRSAMGAGRNTIKVEGVSFRTGEDFQVVDRRGRKLSPRTIRLGTKVMVLSVDGLALQVIVEPDARLPFDQPLK